MGWLAVLLVVPIMKVLPWQGIALLAAGGVIYTIGWVVYFTEKPNPIPGRFGFHEIWHGMVLLAAGAHFLVMYLYILPLP